MIIRAKTFKQWMRANFDKEELRDLAQYGANTGWPGLTYYTDTCKLYAKYKDEIWELLCQSADNFGQTPLQAVAGFNGAKHVSDSATFENLMVWFAAEEYARQLTEAEDD